MERDLTPVLTDKLASPGAFRFALAFAVFLHHTTSYNLGMTAVLVFFVLSGYWVAVMWTRTYSKTSAAYFTYLVSRFWRVVPVFALCSGLSWALLYWRGVAPDLSGNLAHQIFSNIMIFGYNSLDYQANVPGWSLDMEMQFYLIAPLLVFLISKNMLVVLVCAAASLFSQKLGGATTVAPFLYFFAIGVTAARHDLKPNKWLAYGSLAATFVVMLVCGVMLAQNLMHGVAEGAQALAFGSKTNILMALMLTPWAIYTTRQKTGSTDRMFGDLSYIFYLLHWSVLGALKTGEGSYVERILLCGEAFVVICAASYLIWTLFDHPINHLRATWVSRRRLAPTPLLGAAQPA